MSEERNLSVEDIQNIENVVGYTFKNKKLLIQAFTRKSYVNEHRDEKSNEVLEFYGDRALDITVTVAFAQMFGWVYEGVYITSNPFQLNDKVDEEYLSNLRSSIVCKKALAQRVDELDIVKYLRAGKGDIESNAIESASIKEDLLEAICGAIAIDLEWNFNEYSKIIAKLIQLPSKIETLSKGSDHILELYNWHMDKFGEPIDIYIEACEDGGYTCNAIVDLQNKCLQYSQHADTPLEAKNEVLEFIYGELFEQNKRFEYYPDQILDVFKPTWLDVTEDRAINIVQEIVQANILCKAEYDFEQVGNDKNGNPLWACTVKYEFNPNSYGMITRGDFLSKKEAKKHAAFELVNKTYEKYNFYPNPPLYLEDN